MVGPLLERINLRTDLPLVRRFLREVACDSALEAVVLLALLADQSRPDWECPIRLGFRRYSIMIRDRQAGDQRHPGLEVELEGLRLVFLFQVRLGVSRKGIRVDALVGVRWHRSTRWLVFEVDGPLHSPEADGARQVLHGMSEVRITEPMLKRTDLLAVIAARIKAALGLADASS